MSGCPFCKAVRETRASIERADFLIKVRQLEQLLDAQQREGNA